MGLLAIEDTWLTSGVMYDFTFSKLANHQIRHKATHKAGCQPGDCIWSLVFLIGVCGYVWEEEEEEDRQFVDDRRRKKKKKVNADTKEEK